MNTQPSHAIAFIDLKAQRRRLGDKIDAAIGRVLDHSQFIMGPEVAKVEAELARFAKTKHCLTCASGTDALLLPLMARGIGPGDAVFVPAFTFVATAEAPALLGATPVFVDVMPDSFNMDPRHLALSIAWAKASGLRPKAIIPVDLFGLPADYLAIRAIAEAESLFLLADGCQSFGAAFNGKPVGSLGDATATSFFPAKPLGCYGDGGAVFTDNDDLAEMMQSIRVHGQGGDRYDNVRIGLNGRFDTIQAAILLEKLAIFPDEIDSRQRVARRYTAAFQQAAQTPVTTAREKSVWAQYTLVVNDRDRMAARLKDAGIPTAIYYPIPLSQQTGYRHYPKGPNGTPVSERLAASVISLPMHPYLDEATQDRIIAAALSSCGNS